MWNSLENRSFICLNNERKGREDAEWSSSKEKNKELSSLVYLPNLQKSDEGSASRKKDRARARVRVYVDEWRGKEEEEEILYLQLLLLQ